MRQDDSARGRPPRAQLLGLALALALASATVLAGGVLAEDDSGPTARAAAALKLKQTTIDKTGMVDSAHWTVTESAAQWDTEGFRGTYAWTIPSSIPAGGAQGNIRVTATDKSGGRYNGVIGASGSIIEGGSAQAQALADKNGGQPSVTASTNFKLVPDSCGSSCTVVVGVQDGPTVTFRYEADPCPGGTVSPARAHTSAINEVRVTKVTGGVEYHKAGAPDNVWCVAEVDSVLKQGDEVSCDPDGEVTLQFADNSTVVVRNTSQLKIASFFTEGGVVRTEILLKMGEVAAKVNKSEATKSDFRFKWPTATASVRDTAFSVFYDPGSKAGLETTTEGRVKVDPTKRGLETVIVPAGKQVEVTPNAISDIAKIGKAGARGGVNRIKARDKVLDVIAKGDDPCGVTTPRTKAYSITPAPKGWKVTVKLIGTNAGSSKWKVIRGKVRPTNALARKLKKGCA